MSDLRFEAAPDIDSFLSQPYCSHLLQEQSSQVASSVFGSPEWIKACSAALGEPIQILAVLRKGVLRAWIPFQTKKVKFWTKAYSPGFGLWHGPFFYLDKKEEMAAFQEKKALQEGMQAWFEVNFDYVSLYLDFSDPILFQNRGWQVTPRASFETDLPSSMDRYSRNRRRNMKKSESAGQFIREGEAWNSEYRIALQTLFAKHSISGISVESVQKIHQALHDSGVLRVYCAYDKDQSFLGFHSFLLCEASKTAYSFYTAMTPGGDRDGASSLLLHKSMEMLHELGFATMDHYGADHPGVIQFKNGFADRYIVRHSYEFFKNWRIKALLKLKNG